MSRTIYGTISLGGAAVARHQAASGNLSRLGKCRQLTALSHRPAAAIHYHCVR